MNDHGGTLFKTARELGVEPEAIIDFSSNINPLSPPDGLGQTLCEALPRLTAYPDAAYDELRQTIAAHHSVDPDCITVGNGAADVIWTLVRACAPRRALVLAPTFSEYTHALSAAHSQVDYFELREEQKFLPDRDALANRLARGYDLVMLCNPNNPTSSFLDISFVEDIVRSAAACGTRVCVDESFFAFTAHGDPGARSSIDIVMRYSNLVVIRSLTKYYAVPGLRIGYAVSTLPGLARL